MKLRQCPGVSFPSMEASPRSATEYAVFGQKARFGSETVMAASSTSFLCCKHCVLEPSLAVYVVLLFAAAHG